ncbi:hypothetical protein [Parasphingopyxis marina]|uniref:Uncharacterized protein n=1 Tax=Parasphingopyxis marina TaxID=2761622 RepID=A0A842HXE9_9SPHN|nr:hypothetical protein [Parasphingopyxis marina]MBC2776620.1 hypothetical protein [Parasphingopyxis marina]
MHPIPPDGLSSETHGTIGRFSHHANWLSLLLLGALIGIALSGWLGGGSDEIYSANTRIAHLRISAPAIIRNGEFLETTVSIHARERIAEPAIRLDPSLWRDITINTVFPEPAEQEYASDQVVFSYGSLEPGDELSIKLDGQINPSLFAGTNGAIALYDGEREIATIPLSIRVLP